MGSIHNEDAKDATVNTGGALSLIDVKHSLERWLRHHKRHFLSPAINCTRLSMLFLAWNTFSMALGMQKYL